MQHHHRETTAYCQINPRVYVAHHFGHKLHVDQNEKLCMFGVTHVLAIDGYSEKILSLISMPKKTAMLYINTYFDKLSLLFIGSVIHMIYVTHFLILNSELLSTFGIWDQIHVDHGTEWAIMLFMQKALSFYRNDRTVTPYVQTSSTNVCSQVIT